MKKINALRKKINKNIENKYIAFKNKEHFKVTIFFLRREIDSIYEEKILKDLLTVCDQAEKINISILRIFLIENSINTRTRKMSKDQISKLIKLIECP